MSVKALKEDEVPIEPQKYFKVRINSIPLEVPLQFDILLYVSGRLTLFRKPGDVLTRDRLSGLKKHGAKEFLIPDDQRGLYLQTLKDSIADPGTDKKDKGRIIKESAFIHVEDLFTKQDIRPVVETSKQLVEEMVSFVTEDVDAAVSLMRLSVHDYYTYNHCVDVAVYAITLAKKIFGDDKNLLFHAGLGGLLHDVGKRRISKEIINKMGPLTGPEWQEVKNHPKYGVDFLKSVNSIPVEAKRVVHEHHENFDGTGYPQGLKEEEISKLSRIVMIADVFDALTTDRSYHKAINPSEALKTMYSMQPGKFDPNLFKTFNKNFEKKGPIQLPKDFDPCQTRKMIKPTEE